MASEGTGRRRPVSSVSHSDLIAKVKVTGNINDSTNLSKNLMLLLKDAFRSFSYYDSVITGKVHVPLSQELTLPATRSAQSL